MRVDKVREEYDLEVEWRAFDLHPGIPPEGMPVPWPPEDRAARRKNFERMADQEGLPYGERTHWYASGPAHEACEWAKARAPGSEECFRRALFRAYFVEHANIASADVLARIATELGLDAVGLRVALEEGRYREQVQAQYDEAHRLGVSAVPTFIAGRYALIGLHPTDAFRRLMELVEQPPRSQ